MFLKIKQKKRCFIISNAGGVGQEPQVPGSSGQENNIVENYLAGNLKSNIARRLQSSQSFAPSEATTDYKNELKQSSIPRQEGEGEIKILKERDILLYKKEDGWQIYLPIDVFTLNPSLPLIKQESKLEEDVERQLLESTDNFPGEQAIVNKYNINSQWLSIPKNVVLWLKKFKTRKISLEKRQKVFDFYGDYLDKSQLIGQVPYTFIFNPYYSFLARLLEEPNRELSNEQTQKHHIIPKFLGGPDDDSNLIDLTLSEHVCAHLLRYFVWNENRDYGGAFLLATKSASPEQLARAELLYNQEIKNYAEALLSSDKLL